jgi:hypothetical protein
MSVEERRGRRREALRDRRRTWQVERKPKMSAEGAMTAMIFARDGARPDRTPIWIPSEPKLAKLFGKSPGSVSRRLRKFEKVVGRRDGPAERVGGDEVAPLGHVLAADRRELQVGDELVLQEQMQGKVSKGLQ